MANRIIDLFCPQCGEAVGKFDCRNGTFVPHKKPFRLEHNKIKLKCPKCNQFINPQSGGTQYHWLG